MNTVTMQRRVLTSAGYILVSISGNMVLSILFVRILRLPIFMDSIFTVWVTLIAGLIPGLIAGALYNVISSMLIYTLGIQVLYGLCNMATALVVWLFARKRKTMTVFDLSMTAICAAFANSLIGGIISAALNHGTDSFPTDMLVAGMLMHQLPLLGSTILARIPINLLDKAIAVFGGYGIYRITRNAKD